MQGRRSPATPDGKDLSLLDLWLVIRKRRVLLVCFALGAAALGFGFGVMRGKEYTATGEIEIQPGSASSLKSITSLFDSELSSLDEIMESLR